MNPGLGQHLVNSSFFKISDCYVAQVLSSFQKWVIIVIWCCFFSSFQLVHLAKLTQNEQLRWLWVLTLVSYGSCVSKNINVFISFCNIFARAFGLYAYGALSFFNVVTFWFDLVTDVLRPCNVRVNTLKLDVDFALLELGKHFTVQSAIYVKF